MCYYIGIEDLAANALIEILRQKKDEDLNQYSVSLRELEQYGAGVVRYLNKEKGEKALLILSKAGTISMFRDYSDFFEERRTENGIEIALQKGKTVKDLVIKFRTYIALDLVKAYMDAAVVSVLNGCIRKQEI